MGNGSSQSSVARSSQGGWKRDNREEVRTTGVESHDHGFPTLLLPQTEFHPQTINKLDAYIECPLVGDALEGPRGRTEFSVRLFRGSKKSGMWDGTQSAMRGILQKRSDGVECEDI